MSAVTLTATVREDGSLVIPNVPFPPGHEVQVVLTPPAAADPTEGGKYPLRGSLPYRYDDPFGCAWTDEELDEWANRPTARSWRRPGR